MDRTRAFAPLIVSALACVACGGAVQAGLPNVHALGRTQAVDPKPMAALANGDDACGREGSVLRGKLPPCPNVEKTRADFGFTSRAAPAPATPLVVPWTTRRARAWPCLENPEPAMAMSTTPIDLVPASCAFMR